MFHQYVSTPTGSDVHCSNIFAFQTTKPSTQVDPTELQQQQLYAPDASSMLAKYHLVNASAIVNEKEERVLAKVTPLQVVTGRTSSRYVVSACLY